MYFVMKVSKLCNLRCRYCYEYEELGLKECMSIDKLDFFFTKLSEWYINNNEKQSLDFVLHGGEPLLLKDKYLCDFSTLQEKHLKQNNIPYNTSLQTNLTIINNERIDLLERLNITLGVSLDVFGSQRVNINGKDSQEKVLNNLQFLFQKDAIRRLGVGAISVLHNANLNYAVNIFNFYNELELSYRILPVFSLEKTLPGIEQLTLTHGEVVESLKRVARAQFESNSNILIYPLHNYMTAAINYLAKTSDNAYDPGNGEWALIVNTNGNVYNHAEAYSPEGLMGNVFNNSMTEIMDGTERQRVIALRQVRASLCNSCEYGQSCSRLPIVEGLPSELAVDVDGNLRCNIAKPMIEFYIDMIKETPSLFNLIETNKIASQNETIPFFN